MQIKAIQGEILMQTLELEQHTTGSIPAPDWKYAIMREHPSILTVIVLCLMGGGLAALLEVWAVMCLSLSQFTLYGILWTVPQLPFLLYRTSRRKTAVMVAFWIVLVILWAIPWSSRKASCQ
jgi:hypothetical protein